MSGGVDLVTKSLASVAGVVLLVMLSITVGNIGLRLFATPYHGTFEVVGLLAVLVNGLALAEAQRSRSHIAIDLVMRRTSVRTQLYVGAMVTVISVVLFSLLAQQLTAYGLNLRDQGAVTDSLRLPFWPVSLVLAVGVAGLVLALLADLAAVRRNLRSANPETIW
ncbi:TRAP transporter small permease [Phytoactinopolyspora mesophila]|uniref:TRAP transporter small permease subunit n=1 Tax=Phytoactinopolyspora mesophila TaxID=2650750 RepID=A0A7K3MD79_9ACTN|nr:TRAP transporter small permease [Phytoactinopolyspora mesophila]NDL60358.1 TRAP transporter small permease subunit [Phytoactinopolyspora mesophila]